VCDLQLQINNVVADVATIEADYEVNCLEGVTANAGTHDVLQAVITTLCEVQSDLATLAVDVSEQYIRIDQINDYIAAYLNANTSNLVNAKMIPYVALEFYGDLIGKFDFTGAGIGAWKDINLCNGNNGTPDKRGRVAVCAIVDMGGGDLDPEVDPAVNPLFNPNYVINDNTNGVNFTTLNVGQIPDHTHFATVTINDPGHVHDILGIRGGDNSDNNNQVRFAGGDKNQGETGFYFTNTQACQTKVTGLKGTGTGQNVFVLNSNIGGNQPHSNLQPVYPCYYIMYIPT
jgi:microcystin-dependent protein